MTSLGILTVATNRYVNYWQEQAASAHRQLSNNFNLTFHVFTDDVGAVLNFGRGLGLKVRAYPIEAYGWPEATLYRYALITKFASEFSEDILMHLDADMIVRAQFEANDLITPLKNEICLVSHPGFFRPRGVALIKFYLQSIGHLFSDAYDVLTRGGVGSWEVNPSSLAFVPRKGRSHYVCGGVWWGTRKAIIDLVSELASRVKTDESNGVLAVWHDESHLNWWASKNQHGLSSPAFCFADGYPQLSSLPMVIEAVDKRLHPL